jgi:hypothetical protein
VVVARHLAGVEPASQRCVAERLADGGLDAGRAEAALAAGGPLAPAPATRGPAQDLDVEARVSLRLALAACLTAQEQADRG